MDVFEVVLRAIASLIVVVGLIVWLGKRFNADGSGSAVANLMGPGKAAKNRSKGTTFGSLFAPKGAGQPNLVNVVGRQALVGRTSITVVDVDGQRLVLGVTDTNVSVLHARSLSESTSVVPLDDVVALDSSSSDLSGPLAFESSSDEAFAEALDGALSEDYNKIPGVVSLVGNSPIKAATSKQSSNSEQEGAVVSLSSRMDGSILSPNTWRQAKAAMKVARVGGNKTTNN